MHSSFLVRVSQTNTSPRCSQGDQPPEDELSWCVKCCETLNHKRSKKEEKKKVWLETLVVLSTIPSFSDSQMLLIFSNERQDPVETRATSCLPTSCRAQDILQNLSRFRMHAGSFDMWSFVLTFLRPYPVPVSSGREDNEFSVR